MHILFLPSSFPSNYNTYSGLFYKIQAEAIEKQGLKVGVIAPDIRSFRECFKFNNYKIIGKEYNENLTGGSPVFRKIGFNFYPFNSNSIERTFVKYAEILYRKYVKTHGEPDLIHCHSCLWSGAAALHLKSKFNIDYILTEHSSAVMRGNIDTREANLCHRVYQQADRVFAVSGALKKSMQSICNRPIEIMHNMIDTSQFPFEENHDKKLLFSLGTLRKEKGFESLILAFKECLTKIPDLKLVIGGDGPEKKALQTLIQILSLNENIILLGKLNQAEVRSNMKKAGIYVSSSSVETFGVTLIEAISSGMVAVATNSGGPADFIKNSNGILCEKNNIHDLSEAILSVYANFESFDRHASSIEIQKKFHTSVISRILTNKYKEVIES